MTDNRLNLFCLVDGEATPFSIEVDRTKTVDHLKDLIKAKKANAYSDVDADVLTLWRVSIPIDPPNKRKPIVLTEVQSAAELDPTDDVSDVFEGTPPKKTIHLIVQRPSPVHAPVPARACTPLSVDSHPGTPLSDEKWQELISKIEDEFFAPASADYTGLVQFVTDESSETQDPPSIANKALEKVHGRTIPFLPLFGVSECGKTRAVIEMLFKNWGFYFNGSIADWGSQDLVRFHDLVQQRKRYRNRDFESNTHVHILALTLVLSRSIGLKILLVIDEAQNLGKMDFGTFISQQISSESEGQDYLRPILSPLVHGFYQIAADHRPFCVVTRGTGLNILDMNWLEDSAAVPKGYNKQLGPFTDFQGWESLEQVQNYLALVRSSLPDESARGTFDIRVSGEAVSELFACLRGRFRPIVTAIESMICARNGHSDWKKTIQDTEEALTSTDRQSHGKGNIPYDIDRMLRQVALHPSRYAKYQNIRTVLQLFVLEHYLHRSPVALHELEAPLEEASVGRILGVTGQPIATVLDEPFALRAEVNYFRKDDPDFHSAICSLFSLSPKASVLGSTWEMAVMPSLVHVFHNKVLSETSLVPLGDGTLRQRPFEQQSHDCRFGGAYAWDRPSQYVAERGFEGPR
ncbi:hypothetical protein KI688_007768 [Linnemannia hyalina]|uniref:Crinkler effector protein N-terminal domain-containing protein n=1 Tax=Linnemannia hyalina TaxID=64524 RepID=A0A9P7XJ88_9FUNG|nr:hypothetical protein KI688_007768 [Linnemannia hyalina]